MPNSLSTYAKVSPEPLAVFIADLLPKKTDKF